MFYSNMLYLCIDLYIIYHPLSAIVRIFFYNSLAYSIIIHHQLFFFALLTIFYTTHLIHVRFIFNIFNLFTIFITFSHWLYVCSWFYIFQNIVCLFLNNKQKTSLLCVIKIKQMS